MLNPLFLVPEKNQKGNGNGKIGLPDSFSTKTLRLDVSETPVTVIPQQKISKTLSSSKIPQKYFTFTFGEGTFTFGEGMFTFGEITFTFGDRRGFRGFWNFFFLLLGGFGTLWVGGARRGFRKYLTLRRKRAAFAFLIENNPERVRQELSRSLSARQVEKVRKEPTNKESTRSQQRVKKGWLSKAPDPFCSRKFPLIFLKFPFIFLNVPLIKFPLDFLKIPLISLKFPLDFPQFSLNSP